MQFLLGLILWAVGHCSVALGQNGSPLGNIAEREVVVSTVLCKSPPCPTSSTTMTVAPLAFPASTIIPTTTTIQAEPTPFYPFQIYPPWLTSWKGIGCFTEGNGTRTLSGASLANYTFMSGALCGSFCSFSNFTFWGVENGGECYCGNSFGYGSVQVADKECSGMICPQQYYQYRGQSDTYCGGVNRISVYSDNGAPPVYPSIVTSVGKYLYAGCYTEAKNTRALAGKQLVDSANMTVESCQTFCSPTYSMFGVEYGSECYCGNSLGNGSISAPDKDCGTSGMTCSGNATEFCGAGNRLGVYKYTK